MKKNTNEFFFQLVALLVAIILVHAIYVTVVRPNADSIVNRAAEVAAAGGDYVVPRSFWVVIKDFEQEACFVLALWALAIMGYKWRTAARESKMLDLPLISVSEGTRILPDDAGQLARPLQSLPDNQKDYLLPRALRTALSRFQVTSSVESATDAASQVCDAQSNRLDSELAMVRYITWAIPSIGFIGTVRGIGAALGEAHRAVEGDISGVTENLGIAFNSTFVALMISIVVMFLVHQLQLLQERLVFDTQTYVDHNLIRHMQTRD
jgi:biopolymer transport protein ExbB/TolQ